jgi:polyphosphate kinase
VAEVFKQLTGLGRASKMKHVWQSPFTLHKRIVARSERGQAGRRGQEPAASSPR